MREGVLGDFDQKELISVTGQHPVPDVFDGPSLDGLPGHMTVVVKRLTAANDDQIDIGGEFQK